MTQRLCEIAALSCALALVVALACCVVSPQAVAWVAGFGVAASLLIAGAAV